MTQILRIYTEKALYGTFIHIPSLTGRLIVAGDILFYQHSVPDGTGNAAILSRQEQNVGRKQTVYAERLSRQGQNVGRKQHQSQTTVPSGTECVCFSAYELRNASSTQSMENKACMTVLMSKTSHVYSKTMLCFHSTPKSRRDDTLLTVGFSLRIEYPPPSPKSRRDGTFRSDVSKVSSLRDFGGEGMSCP
jgi:hypothetical protein